MWNAALNCGHWLSCPAPHHSIHQITWNPLPVWAASCTANQAHELTAVSDYAVVIAASQFVLRTTSTCGQFLHIAPLPPYWHLGCKFSYSLQSYRATAGLYGGIREDPKCANPDLQLPRLPSSHLAVWTHLTALPDVINQTPTQPLWQREAPALVAFPCGAPL